MGWVWLLSHSPGGLTVVGVIIAILLVVVVVPRLRSRPRSPSASAPTPGWYDHHIPPPRMWKSAGEPATAAQISYANHLGFDATGMTKAEASIEISRRTGY